MPIIKLENIVKTYELGDQIIPVLHNISLEVNKGDFISIMGQSGSGKSTLMNIIGLLDNVSSGNYWLDGKLVSTLNEDDFTLIRRKKIGFVFQQYNLLPRLTAIEQVMVPLMYQGIVKKDRHIQALKTLEIVNLSDRLNNKPNELSGGQQQRVSIARALVSDPEIILADEPTGALDSKTGEDLMKLFQELNALGKTIIIITHEPNIAHYAKKIIHIVDGNIVS